MVEDNVINQEIVRAVLSQKGHEVKLVGDGAEAVFAWRESSFDIVLMDVQMPVLDGLAATAEIRALERRSGRKPTPIIALTANAMAEEAERCRQAGTDAHVPKPIDWSTLFSTIDRLCAATGRAAAAEVAVPGSGDCVFDEGVLEDLTEVLGTEQVRSFLVSFSTELQRRIELFEGERATAEDLAKAAHLLVSQAGQLGFGELSAFCQQLEDEALAGGGLDRIGALRVVAERALAAATGSRYAVPSTSAA